MKDKKQLIIKDKKTIILIVGLILLVLVASIALLPKHDTKPAKNNNKKPKTLVDAVLKKIIRQKKQLLIKNLFLEKF